MADGDPRPFSSCCVVPSYGSGQAVIRWTLSANYQDHGVLVYRSVDGADPFVLLTPDPVYGASFVDEDLPCDTKLDQTHYRLDAESPKGTILDGETIRFFERLSPEDYSTARRMMVAKVQVLRKGAGVPVLMFMPGRASGIGTNMDTWTEQPTDVCAYNQDGGVAYRYQRPYQTWVQFVGSTVSRKDRQDGTGQTEDVDTQARLPGFPFPVPGTLLVLPDTDERMVVGDTIKPFQYRGLVAVEFEVVLARLKRTDPRYRIVAPRLDPSLTMPAYTQP